MHLSKRWMWLITVAALITVTAACGGQPAEEPPAEEPTPAEEPAPAPVVPEPVEPEPVVPETPQLQGNIVEIGEGQFAWFNAATRETPGRYYWEVQLRNDTTQTLDLTVTWQFLNEAEEVVKTDRRTVRVQPAETGTFRIEDEMERDLARSVAYNAYSWDWRIVEAS